jgi:hypothetical protein
MNPGGTIYHNRRPEGCGQPPSKRPPWRKRVGRRSLALCCGLPVTAYSIGVVLEQGGSGLCQKRVGTKSGRLLREAIAGYHFSRACAKAIESISNRPTSAGRSDHHRQRGHHFHPITRDPVIPSPAPQLCPRGWSFSGKRKGRLAGHKPAQEKAPPKRGGRGLRPRSLR